VNGIDLSNWNSWVDWRGVEFDFYKATEGVSYVDPTQGTWANKIPIDGPYHFAHPDQNSPEAEAAYFVRHAIPGVMWALDCEMRGSVSPLAIMGAAALAAWCDRFHELVAPHLGPNGFHYTPRSYAPSLWPRLQRPWRWWLAGARGVPTYQTFAGKTVDIEQYAIVGGIDRNISYTPIVSTEDDMWTDPEKAQVIAQVGSLNQWRSDITGVIQGQIANGLNDPNGGVQVKLDRIIDRVDALESGGVTGALSDADVARVAAAVIAELQAHPLHP